MRIALIGLLCSLAGLVVSFVAGIVVSTAAYPPSHPGADTTGQAIFPFFDNLVVALTLVLGLCIAAPLLIRGHAGGLRTMGGAVLAALMLLGQVAMVGLLLGGWFAQDWPKLAIVTIAPGLAATALAILFFDRFADPARAAESGPPLAAGLGATLAGSAVSLTLNMAANPAFRWYAEGGGTVAVTISLLAGLGAVAPLAPPVVSGGLRTLRGLILAASIALLNFLLLDGFSGPRIAIDGSAGDSLTLATSYAGVAAGLLFFDWQAVRRRRKRPR